MGWEISFQLVVILLTSAWTVPKTNNLFLLHVFQLYQVQLSSFHFNNRETELILQFLLFITYFYIFSPGQCLNFNCMFTLVLMLRQSITFLRTHGFGSFLPLDHHLYLHKMCGWVIFVLSIVHALMHLINFSKCSQNPLLDFLKT